MLWQLTQKDTGHKNVAGVRWKSAVDSMLPISTSGKSDNVVEGIKISKKNGAKVIALTGMDGGVIKKLADILLAVPSTDTPRIQEVHRIILHIICNIIDDHFFDN